MRVVLPGVAGAVGTEQSEHAWRYLEGEVAQRPVSAALALADIFDTEIQESPQGTA